MSNWLDPAVPNVARLLKRSGYATSHIGKWHLGNGSGGPPIAEYGFDFVGSGESDRRPDGKPADEFYRARSTALFVDEALQFIEQNKARPFYLQLWTLIPHATLNPTAEQMKPYDFLGPGNAKFPHAAAAQIFCASVTDLDTQVGRLFAGLDRLGLADNTLILFSSDNGPEDIHVRNAGHSGVGSAGPFRGRKRSLYEGGVRVSGIVCWPGHVPANRVEATAVVAGIDWLPTVCKFAAVDVPADHRLDGEEMTDVLLGKSQPRKRPLMWEWRFGIPGEPFHKSPILAIRDGDWKLLLNPDRSRIELYDIPRDPTQMTNLASAQPAIVERLSKQVLAWQRELPKGPIDRSAGKSDYAWPKPKGE